MKRSVVVCLVLLTACGPGARRDPTGDEIPPDAPPHVYGAEGSPETCADNFDNEGDGLVDCADVDCSGVGSCPVCGDVDVPESTPLVLPDGTSSGAACTSDAQCGGSTPNCIVSPYLDGGGECHGSYTSTLLFSGFPTNALLTDPTKLTKICVNMEHSYLRDLQIDLIPPDDTRLFVLQKFRTQSGTEIYLGDAHDPDDSSPSPGVGFDYCWTPTGMYEMIDSSTADGVVAPTTQSSSDGSTTLSPGDYKSASPWNDLLNVPLNGEWKIRVTDLWGSDNGYIFSWSITFDSSIIHDCSGPVIQ